MLELNNVSYTYPDSIKSLKGITFSVKRGEAVGIAGANGAGKSTLLYLISGVLTPSGGEVIVAGKHIEGKKAKEIIKTAGLVFQNSDDQLFTTSVYDDIAFGPKNMGLTDKEVNSRVNDAMTLCCITALAKRAPYRLSEGEKKLAAIASVISMEPELLLMDEPSASLDPKSRRGLIALLLNLNHTKIIASHDLDMLWDVCDRVIIIKDGVVAADGKTKEVLSSEALLYSSGLELPLRLQKI